MKAGLSTPRGSHAALSATQLEVIDLAAKGAQRLGFARTVGQVYGLLFTAPRPLSLDAVAETLAISKTSASSAARQLLSLNAIRQAWLPGERKDHYEVRTDLRAVLRANYHSFLKPPADRARETLTGILDSLDEDLAAGRLDTESHSVAHARVETVRAAHRRLADLLPLIERLL